MKNCLSEVEIEDSWIPIKTKCMNSFFHLEFKNKFDRRGLKSWPFVSFEIEDSRIPIKYKPMSNQAKRKRKNNYNQPTTNNQQQTTDNQQPTTDNHQLKPIHDALLQNSSDLRVRSRVSNIRGIRNPSEANWRSKWKTVWTQSKSKIREFP